MLKFALRRRNLARGSEDSEPEPSREVGTENSELRREN
jgi:hypothetical protein